MPSLARIDWAESTATERLEALRRATGRQVCAMARAVEWDRDTFEVIGWISAQICLDLGSALTLFMNAEPERFNHMAREDVPDEYQGLCAQLDALCQRINAGFYLPDPARKMQAPERLADWMQAQVEDTRKERPGRWQFNPAVVAPMITQASYKPTRRKRAGKERGLLGRLLAPLLA